MGLVEGLTTPHRQTNEDMRFGKWNIRSVYRRGAVTLVMQELAKYTEWKGNKCHPFNSRLGRLRETMYIIHTYNMGV